VPGQRPSSSRLNQAARRKQPPWIRGRPATFEGPLGGTCQGLRKSALSNRKQHLFKGFFFGASSQAVQPPARAAARFPPGFPLQGQHPARSSWNRQVRLAPIKGGGRPILQAGSWGQAQVSLLVPIGSPPQLKEVWFPLLKKPMGRNSHAAQSTSKGPSSTIPQRHS